MKRCPQCGAEYDDYVQYCFVDGAELVVGASSTPQPAPARPTTPVPAPVAAPSHPAMGSRPPKPHRPPPPEPRSSPLWAFLVLMFLGGSAIAFGGLVAALLWVSTQTEPAPSPQPPVPAPVAPITLPPPVPGPAPSAPKVTVLFESVPAGAQVWEQEKYLCGPTPCAIEHPDFAPLPREFVLKLEGYQNEPHRMSDTSTQRIELKPSTPKPAPPVRPRPTAGEDILQTR